MPGIAITVFIMKRLQHILHMTLILAVAVAPLGSAYAGMENTTGSKTHCQKMGAKMDHNDMSMSGGAFCPHHDNTGDQNSDSGMKCEKDCNDCNAVHHVASLSHCPMHNGNMEADSSHAANSSPHACPHHKTLQPPKQ